VALTSPVLFAALHWASGVADLLCAAALALAVSLLAGGPRGPAREGLALAAYAVALASKEIAVGAAPVLAALHARSGGRAGPARAAACLALAALFALPASGAWQTGAGEPYAMRPAAALLNLPAFLAAATMGGLAWAEPSDLAWARQPWVRVAGWALLALWLAALIARRSRPAWLGFAWFLGLVAPVVMLERQLHFYYLCCALPGLVASVACLVAGGATGSRALPRWAAWAAAALVLAQVAAVEARYGARLKLAPLPADFVLRRAMIARNALADLGAARGTLRPRVVMLGQQPVDVAWQGASATEATDYTRDPWWDENVRAALSDGEALRVMFPGVRDVVFKPWLEPEDTSSTIAAYRIDGHLTASDYASFVGLARGGAPVTFAGRLARAGELIRRRLFREALVELESAHAEVPDHPDVLINVGAIQAQLGDSSAALATLARAVAVAPGDLDARYNLGLLQWRMGRREEARATWARLLADAADSDLARAVRELLAGRAR
jgi:tetratricopeptide (TPR) repeat protein